MKTNKILLKFFWKFAKKYKYKLCLMFVFMYLLKIAKEVFFRPYLLKILGNAFQNDTLTLTMAVVVAILYAFFSSFDYFVNMSFGWKLDYGITSKLQKDARIYLMDYAMKHSINYFNNKMSGVIANKINNISEPMGFVFTSLLRCFSIFIAFVISLVVYARINIYFAMFFIIWVVCFYFAHSFTIKKIYKAKKERTEETNKISGIMNDSLSNILNVKSFSNRNQELEEVKKQGAKILDKESKMANAEIILNIIMFIMIVSIELFSFAFAFYLTTKNKITIGTFLFICQNITLLVSMINDIFSNYIVNLTILISEIKDGIDTILQPIDIKNKDDARSLQNVKGKIVFKNVVFYYE